MEFQNEDIETTQDEQAAPETETAQPQSSSEAAQSTSEAIFDIDSAKKIRFQGKEMTPQELRSAYLRQSDYTQKTQAIAEERKYFDNLQHDLQTVLRDPTKAAIFKQVYPQKFHGYLQFALSQSGQAQAPQQTAESKPNQLPPEVVERIDRLESAYNSAQVKAIEAQLDGVFAKMEQKYPYADREMAIARAQSLLDKGHEEITEEMWDKIYKQTHDRIDGFMKTQSKQQITNQRTANAKGRDVPTGGGIPGQAPRKESFKEATERAIRELGAR